MDPVTVAATAFSFLTPYLIEGGKELSKGLFKDLWTNVKNLFKTDEEKASLSKLEENPKDPKILKDVQNILEKKLANSEQTLEEISNLVERIRVEQNNESINVMKSKGKGNINMQGVNVGRDLNVPNKGSDEEK